MNLDFPPQKIVKFFDVNIKSPRGQAILEKVKILIRPPKPYPENCKQIPLRKSETA